MIDIRQYSAEKVGHVWNESDHIYIVGQLDQVDRLAQALHDWREWTKQIEQERRKS